MEFNGIKKRIVHESGTYTMKQPKWKIEIDELSSQISSMKQFLESNGLDTSQILTFTDDNTVGSAVILSVDFVSKTIQMGDHAQVCEFIQSNAVKSPVFLEFDFLHAIDKMDFVYSVKEDVLHVNPVKTDGFFR
jgi:hypothetical protein